MAATAVAVSAFHRSVTTLSPGRPAVTIQDPAASVPRSSTRGTGVKAAAHARRAASPPKSMPLAAGAHFTKEHPGPRPTSNVSPPSSFSHTARSGRPAATASTGAGTVTPTRGSPAITRPACHDATPEEPSAHGTTPETAEAHTRRSYRTGVPRCHAHASTTRIRLCTRRATVVADARVNNSQWRWRESNPRLPNSWRGFSERSRRSDLGLPQRTGDRRRPQPRCDVPPGHGARPGGEPL